MTGRELVLTIRQVLADLSMVSEQKAAGIITLGGSSTKKGHVALWLEDTGPHSLRDVFLERFREARGDEVKLRETLEAARVALEDARVRPAHQRIDGDWKPLFVSQTQGEHYVRAAVRWGISPSYARKLRRSAGVSPLDGT